MCTPIFTLIGSVVSAIGQMQQGKAQQAYYNAQAQHTLNDAAYREDEYKAKAEKVRRAGKSQQGEANAALAASGVKLGEGTPLELQKNIIQRTEDDALSEILSGKRIMASGKEEAGLLVQAGNNARKNATMGAFSSVLSAGGKFATSGWR